MVDPTKCITKEVRFVRTPQENQSGTMIEVGEFVVNLVQVLSKCSSRMALSNIDMTPSRWTFGVVSHIK